MLEGMLRRLKRNNLVLMKHDKKNELSTTYEPQLYKVKDKKGNQVVVSNNNNPARVLRRNTAEVKQYHSTYKQPNNTKAKKKDVTPTLARKDTAVDPGVHIFSAPIFISHQKFLLKNLLYRSLLLLATSKILLPLLLCNHFYHKTFIYNAL